MKKTVLLIILSFFSFHHLNSEETREKSRLAILDLEPGAGVSIKESEYISDILRTELVKTKLFIVIDRSSIKKILEEQAFQQKGCVDTKCSVKIGQLLAANKILEGKVQYRNGKYNILANIVDVESGKLDFAEQITLDSIEDFESKNEIFIRKISADITGADEGSIVIRKPRSPYVLRSIAFPGWGQFHKGEEQKGLIYFSVGILLFGNLYSKYTNFQKAQAEYSSAQGLPFFLGQYALPYNFLTINPKKEALIEAQNEVNLSIGLLTAFWLLNIADAYYFEPNTKKVSFLLDISRERNFFLDRSLENNHNYISVQVKYKF
jgi:TolB-like protein